MTDTVSNEQLLKELDKRKDHRQYLVDNDWGKSHIDAVDREIAMLTELKEWRENVEAMLSSGDKDVIRCHEGGGPESLVGSLVLTMMRTRSTRDAKPTEFSVTLTPTRQGFKHPDDEDKMLRLWLGETSLGQPIAMLSYGFYTEGKFEGMDYTPIDTSTLELIPLVMKDRLDAINKLTGAARVE